MGHQHSQTVDRERISLLICTLKRDFFQGVLFISLNLNLNDHSNLSDSLISQTSLTYPMTSQPSSWPCSESGLHSLPFRSSQCPQLIRPRRLTGPSKCILDIQHFPCLSIKIYLSPRIILASVQWSWNFFVRFYNFKTV